MSVRILQGDCLDVLKTLPDESVHCCVTSPPYWGLRDYGVAGQLGLESTPAEYVEKMVAVFREVRRVLRDDGTLWLNLGDSYANDTKWGGITGGKHATGLHGTTGLGRNRQNTGLKSKDLVGIPWRVAFALQADGWYLRQDIIWAKPNPMPESVRDRCTKSHEYLFLLAKSEKYYCDMDAIKEDCVQDESRPTFRGGAYCNNSTFDNTEGGKSTDTGNVRRSWRGSDFDSGKTGEMMDTRGGKIQRKPSGRPGGKKPEQFDDMVSGAGRSGVGEGLGARNKRSVWTVATQPFKEAHFATFPPSLIEPCILAGCPAGGTVLDPFGGAGTTGLVADRLQRGAVLIELNPDYAAMAEKRIRGDSPMFAEVAA